ncbi:MAG TPA: tRNA (guanosine(46)-N7)-methyltransferase TrmB [bacterium]|nr:tRNA (guanosine(46)-N7)-methyltransferase TrmB [bacterium]
MPIKKKTSSPPEIARTPFFYPARISLRDYDRIILEIGPGRGDFLFHLAEKNPEAVIVGIEIKEKRVAKLIRRVENRGLKNVVIILSDAKDVIEKIFENSSVEEIHINFPDPWPKNRHSKNRLITELFLEKCALILKDGGAINFATDDFTYAQAAEKSALCVKRIKLAPPSEDQFPTYFAMKWKMSGRKLNYFRFVKT